MIFTDQESKTVNKIQYDEIIQQANLTLQEMVILLNVISGHTVASTARKMRISRRRVTQIMKDIRNKLKPLLTSNKI